MKGIAYSAVTVINAIAAGKGGAVGIDLEVRADVETIETGLEGEIEVQGESYKDFELVRSVKEVLEDRLNLKFGIKFKIESEIPIGKGLKSSSAVSNALTEAILKTLGMDLDDREILEVGIEASKRAGVTLTGALDDAYASYFGGLCLTNNLAREVLSEKDVGKRPVVILIPEKTVFTKSLKDIDFEGIRPYIELIFRSALKGEWKKASLLNGLVYSSFFGYDTEPMMEVLEYSEMVGLSGTGPAIYSITDSPNKVKKKWDPLGDILEVSTR